MGRIWGRPIVLVTKVFHVVRIDAAQQAIPLHNLCATLVSYNDWLIVLENFEFGRVLQHMQEFLAWFGFAFADAYRYMFPRSPA
jgi:hypothetical protein